MPELSTLAPTEQCCTTLTPSSALCTSCYKHPSPPTPCLEQVFGGLVEVVAHVVAHLRHLPGVARAAVGRLHTCAKEGWMAMLRRRKKRRRRL